MSHEKSQVLLVPKQRQQVSTETAIVDPQPDRRPRLLRRILPTAHATAIPLDGIQEARMKFIAYH